MRPLARRLSAAINRVDGYDGKPFHSSVAMTPRVGERWSSWVHYGVMVPGLPEPHRYFGVMALLGTTGVRCFDNDAWIRTTPRDTAYVVAGTAAEGSFDSWSMAGECELRPDGTRLAFGADALVFEGLPPRVRVRRAGAAPVDLALEVRDEVATFSRIPGLYDHFSRLARCRGTIGDTRVDAFGTYEYARGIGPYSLVGRRVPRWVKTPVRAFTYQVLNVTTETQLLLTVAGPRFGAHVHEGVWERGAGDHGAMHRDVELAVLADRPEPLVTPDGRTMRMPARWSWTVRDAEGGEVARLACVARDDWRYGLGTGYVGSFAFTGTHRGRDAAGSAYVEWIEV